MANYTAVSLDQIRDVKNVISDEILITASGITEAMWEQLKIFVKPGIENEYTEYIYEGNYKGAAPKYKGSTLNNTLGQMLPRKLKVQPVWNRIPDSLDNYFEKTPISMQRLSTEGVTAEHTQFQLLRASEQTSAQVRSNFFLGSRPKNKTNFDSLTTDEQKEYALMDGIYTKIANMIAGTNDDDKDDKNKPLISSEKGNLIETDPLLGAATGAKETYQSVVNFYNSLDAHLLAQENILFYVCPKLWNVIKQGYNLTYVGMQTPDVNNPNFRFTDMPNVQFLHYPTMGYGDNIIATVENNLGYGTDINTDGEPNKAFIDINKDPDDAHNIIIQIDLRADTIVRNPTKGYFATNGEKNYPSIESWKKAEEEKHKQEGGSTEEGHV